MTKRRERSVFRCPNCGSAVKAGAAACRECGSDANTGWRDEEEIDYAQVDLPDGYRDDGAERDELPPRRLPVWVVVTALVVAALLVAGATGLFSLL